MASGLGTWRTKLFAYSRCRMLATDLRRFKAIRRMTASRQDRTVSLLARMADLGRVQPTTAEETDLAPFGDRFTRATWSSRGYISLKTFSGWVWTSPVGACERV